MTGTVSVTISWGRSYFEGWYWIKRRASSLSNTPWINSPSATRSGEGKKNWWFIDGNSAKRNQNLKSSACTKTIHSRISGNWSFHFPNRPRFQLFLTIFTLVKEVPKFIRPLLSCVFIRRQPSDLVFWDELKNGLFGKTNNKLIIDGQLLLFRVTAHLWPRQINMSLTSLSFRKAFLKQCTKCSSKSQPLPEDLIAKRLYAVVDILSFIWHRNFLAGENSADYRLQILLTCWCLKSKRPKCCTAPQVRKGLPFAKTHRADFLDLWLGNVSVFVHIK